MITRRVLCRGAACLPFALGVSPIQAAEAGWDAGLGPSLQAIEASIGGRLGVGLLDTQSGKRFAWRGNERFPMCSTFKVLAASAVLARVDASQDQLERRIGIAASALVPYSPITQKHVGATMSLAELCAAALDYSDNTAGNLLLAAIGGPDGLTRYARTLGDDLTRLDRTETSLNEALSGDPRDTTAPASMLANLERLALGDALSPASRDRLVAWMKGNTTGDTRLRAGVPRDWGAADKTGTGDNGTANDIALFWPPDRKPVLMAVYLTGATSSPGACSDAIAAVARAALTALPPA